jgi:hypothetical protein
MFINLNSGFVMILFFFIAQSFTEETQRTVEHFMALKARLHGVLTL